MLVEELVSSIQVSAVEQSIPIHNIFPVRLGFVVFVGVLAILQVVFVRLWICRLLSWLLRLSKRCFFLRKAFLGQVNDGGLLQRFQVAEQLLCIFFIQLLVLVGIVISAVLPPQLVIEVVEDVAACDLDQGILLCL